MEIGDEPHGIFAVQDFPEKNLRHVVCSEHDLRSVQSLRDTLCWTLVQEANKLGLEGKRVVRIYRKTETAWGQQFEMAILWEDAT